MANMQVQMKEMQIIQCAVKIEKVLTLTELAGDLFLREQVFRVHRSLEVLLEDGQDDGLFLWLPHTSCQQHVP